MATKANRNIKVSQATIDKIKKQGMTASLKSASSNNSPEYREALRRMYGDARVAKATASTKTSSSGRYVGSMFVPDKPTKKPSNPRQADYYAASTKAASTSYSPRPYSEVNKTTAKPKPKPTPKSPNGTLTPIQRAQQEAYRSQTGYKSPTPKTAAQIAAEKKKAAAAAKRRADAAAGRASNVRTR
jgi:hypothetical protein